MIPFTELVDVAAERLGGSVLLASDEIGRASCRERV